MCCVRNAFHQDAIRGEALCVLLQTLMECLCFGDFDGEACLHKTLHKSKGLRIQSMNKTTLTFSLPVFGICCCFLICPPDQVWISPRLASLRHPTDLSSFFPQVPQNSCPSQEDIAGLSPASPAAHWVNGCGAPSEEQRPEEGQSERARLGKGGQKSLIN